LERDVPSRYLKNISCEEIAIESPKRITLSGIVVRRIGMQEKSPDTVIIYFQGFSPALSDILNIY
jgi:hypothetical protein